MEKILVRKIAIVISAVVLLRCQIQAQSTTKWWKYGHFYQVYPRSFQDSNGDGVGDLNGITQRLSYFKEIGVTGVWLSPMFASPQVDFGYDISDFRKVDPLFGTMADFDRMLRRCEELNLKLILDFVPNHSSDQHIWFQKSINPNDPDFKTYQNYYIWDKGILLPNGTRAPPSNWLSIFGGSAWTWMDSRQEYYLHQFSEKQPDLNYRNPIVSEEMKEVLRFWLRKGVDGFRVDAVSQLFESPRNPDGSYPNERPSGDCPETPNFHCYLKHTETSDRPETFELTYVWRQVLDEPEFSNKIRILMTEAYSTLQNTIRYYGRTDDVKAGQIVQYGAQIPFNFQLINTNSMSTAYEFRSLIANYLNSLPIGSDIQPNWVLGNHDNRRIGTRYSPQKVDAINMFLITMPGIAITYYGEEIGMTDVPLSFEDTVDPQACETNPEIYEQYSRDPQRSPFQWDSNFQAGFSTARKTWLPVANNYTTVNVALQRIRTNSYFNNFKKLVSLRKSATMKYGGFQMATPNENVLVYKRQLKRGSKYKKSKLSKQSRSGDDIFVIILNLGKNTELVDLKSIFKCFVPKMMKVVVASVQSTDPVIGNVLDTRQVAVQPEVGLVLTGVCGLQRSKPSHSNAI